MIVMIGGVVGDSDDRCSGDEGCGGRIIVMMGLVG